MTYFAISKYDDQAAKNEPTTTILVILISASGLFTVVLMVGFYIRISRGNIAGKIAPFAFKSFYSFVCIFMLAVSFYQVFKKNSLPNR